MGLGLSTPTSSQAVLTELVVGGTVLLQVAGIVGEALPQISALATSFAAVVQSGDQIGKTVGRIVDILVPGRKKKKKRGEEPQPTPDAPPSDDSPSEEPVARKPTKPGKRLNLPSLKPRPGGSHRAPDDPTQRTAPDAGGEEKQPDSLDSLFLTFHRKSSLERALVTAEGERREAIEAGLPAMAGRYEEAVEDLVEELEAAARAGDSERIDDVAARASEAPMGLRRGLQPVLERLLGRGRRFGDLYDGAAGGGDTAKALAALVPVAESLSQEDL
jgi:hypothetical protein